MAIIETTKIQTAKAVITTIQALHEKAKQTAKHYLRLEKELLELIIQIDKIISMLESLIHTNCQPQITNTLKSELGLLSQVDDSRLYPDYQLFNKILDKMYHSNFFNFK